MTQEPWMEERGFFRKISGGNRKPSVVSGSFPIRTESKVELQESKTSLQTQPEQQPLQQFSGDLVMNSGDVTFSAISMTPRHGSMLGSLKAHYRKLRTFKGTVRAIINLRRTPLALLNAVKATGPTDLGRNEDQRSAVGEVPRISATAAATVQTQVHKLVAEGHVVAEMDPTSGVEVTYRQQGNLDHYTEDNLAKRVSLQQNPHMIALTQRLWKCALHNEEKKLEFTDYEAYMLCLHRLILPEFDIDASKELIMDDWKRDSGEKDHLDYAFFHLSMFELVDLWTDTVDPEDYISLLYCITHCLTYLLNECYVLKSLEDISNVNILEESKGMTLESIKQDLQHEVSSGAFAYYQDQVKVAVEAKQQEARGSNASRRKSTTQQRSQTPSRSRPHERKRSSPRNDGSTANVKTSESTSQHRRSRSGSGAFAQDFPKRKFSVQARTNGQNLIADTSSTKAASTTNYSTGTNHHSNTTSPAPPRPTMQAHPTAMIPVSPRRQTTLQPAISPSTYAPGGVILNIGMLDGMPISMPTADDKPAAAASTATMAGFPRRRSRSASNSSQHRRDPTMQAAPGKVDNTRDASFSGLQVSHIESPGSVLRAGTQDPNSSGYILLPGTSSGVLRQPFTVRAAAVAEAAAYMAMSATPANSQQILSVQHQVQQRASQSEGNEATKTISPNTFINNSSLTAPLITIISSKAPSTHETTSTINKIQLQFQVNQDQIPARPQTPYGGLNMASISSPRGSDALTAQAAGIFISTQQRPVKPPTSPRSTILRSAGSILNNEHLTPMSARKLQHENVSMVVTGPSSNVTSTSLAISGKPAAPNSMELSSAGQLPKFDMANGMLENLPLVSDGAAAVSQPKDDIKSLLSPRYIVTTPVAPHHLAQISNLKQSSVRPQGSTRGFARKNSPRIRHQPSSLANGPATSYLQQQRQQRHPSELFIEPVQLE